ILNAKEFIAVDNTVAKFLFDMRVEAMAKFFYVITQLGHQYVILAGVICLSVILIVNKKSYAILGLLVAVLGSGLTVQLGKHIFKINRPVQFSYYHMDSFSFPSGHATAAVAFYGIVTYLLIRSVNRTKQKFALLLGGLVRSEEHTSE